MMARKGLTRKEREQVRFSKIDLQTPKEIREHINELWNDYSRSGNKIVLEFIEEWQHKYNLKLIEENERFS